MRTRSWRGLTSAVRHRRLPVRLRRAARIAASAQTPFVPYYNKNRIKYDHFKWHIYTTDHFEIYYYPEIEQHLERVASYAESAYQKVSADLKHDLAFKVPLILYKTASEFQQQNIEPGELPEGVLAFAEPYRDRMVLPIDEPSDALYRLITHELTHIFEFDIIPRTLLRRGLPLWVDEGLSDYETGYWNPFDLMSVRDAAIADIIPPMSDFQGVQFADGRLPYNLGHAAFEFIESKWGKEGLRQFLFALRKSVIGGGDSAYEEAFKLKPDEFDEQFDKYLKDRFKPFRDKERPADYGSDLAPKRGKTPYVSVVSIEPSPVGRPDGGRGRQPQGPGARHHPAVDQGRQGDPQPHRRLQHRLRLRVHRDAWRLPRQRGAVDVVVAGRRPHRLLRAQGEAEDARPPERPDAEDREALRAEDRWTCRSRRTSAPTASSRLRRRCRNAIADIFIIDLETGADQEPHQRSVRRLRADLGARRQVDRLHRARQRQRQAVPLRRRNEARRHSSRSARTTTAPRSSSTPTRWCSRPPRSIRTSRSRRKSRRTATSTTSGR